ncbi:MAG: hypothetical protein GXX83_11420 [Gaiellales bacterium]|nr:hypothetical protein [Gaiellales bacterium]
MRRLIVTGLLSISIVLVLFCGSAFASNAWMFSQNDMQGVRAGVQTPNAQLSGIVSYTTSKAAVWTLQNTNAGWLVRPPTYPDPKSYYVWYDSSSNATEVILSTQPYSESRAYEICNLDSGNNWYIYIVGTFRHLSYDVNNDGTVKSGAATSNSANNVWCRIYDYSGAVTDPISSYYSFVDNDLNVYDSDYVIQSPLAMNIYAANYDFAAYE